MKMLKLTLNNRRASHSFFGARPLLDAAGKPVPGVYEPAICLEPGQPQVVDAARLDAHRADVLAMLKSGDLTIEEVAP